MASKMSQRGNATMSSRSKQMPKTALAQMPGQAHVHGNVWILLIQIIIGYAWLGIGTDRLLTGSEFSDWLAMGQIFLGSALVVCAVLLVLPQTQIYRDVALAFTFLAFLVGMFLTGVSYLDLTHASSSVALVTTVLFWIQAILLSHVVWQIGIEHEWQREAT